MLVLADDLKSLCGQIACERSQEIGTNKKRTMEVTKQKKDSMAKCKNHIVKPKKVHSMRQSACMVLVSAEYTHT